MSAIIKNFYIYNRNNQPTEQYKPVESLESALRIFTEVKREYGKDSKYLAIGADYEVAGTSKALDLVAYQDYHNRIIEDYLNMELEVRNLLSEEIEKIVKVLERVGQEIHTPNYQTIYNYKTKQTLTVELLKCKSSRYRSLALYRDLESRLYIITECIDEGIEKITDWCHDLDVADIYWTICIHEKLNKKPVRICSECGEELQGTGYVVNSGQNYYCSDDCLYENYDEEEWEEMLEEEGNFEIEF